MSVVKLLADDDFEEYIRISNEAYPAMFTKMFDERKAGWIKRICAPWFSSLVIWVIDFEKLWMYGHVEVLDESYVETLDKLFHVAKKPETTEEF